MQELPPQNVERVLDQVPGADRTHNYVRGLLVEHGALPRRDELAVRYDRWAISALERLTTVDHPRSPGRRLDRTVAC